MKRYSCWNRFAVLLGAWLVLAGNVRAQVKDDAGFFSAAAVSQANEIARDIKLSYGKDFKVETFRMVPPDRAAKFKTLAKAAKQDFFEAWAKSRAKALGVQGVYLQVCKQPAHLELSVSDDTLKKGL